MKKIFFIIFLSTINFAITAQTHGTLDTLSEEGNLQNCIQYALTHQPIIQQSLIDEDITKDEINTKLAEWFPQVNFNFNIQHNYQLPTSISQGTIVTVGTKNSSGGLFSVTQNIFNRDVLLASSTAKDVISQAKQLTDNNEINIIVDVSKAYYAVLLGQEQLNLVSEDIARLSVSQKDTYNQYNAGVVDKTDYKRASIALNNSYAELKQDQEQLKASLSFLKQQMGYPSDFNLTLKYDTTQMEKDIYIDTAQSINYKNRIEYRMLQTQKRLQEADVKYNILGFLPTLSAFGEYNLNYFNDSFSKLYNIDYPNSYIGLELSFPIFEGGKQIQELDEAELELTRINYDFQSLEESINTEYVRAMASYKSNLNNYHLLKINLGLAREVYNTIQLQYRSGIKTYLDVITAESDLRTSQVNYYNALYQVLSSKLDVQKALGLIKY